MKQDTEIYNSYIMGYAEKMYLPQPIKCEIEETKEPVFSQNNNVKSVV